MASAAEMLAGGALLVVAGFAAREEVPHAVAPRPLFALAYLIVFGSLVGFSAYLFLLRRVRPAAATSYAYVNPVIAMFLGVALGGETITAAEWAAMPVILAGVAIVMIGHSRAAAPAPAAERHDTVRS